MGWQGRNLQNCQRSDLGILPCVSWPCLINRSGAPLLGQFQSYLTKHILMVEEDVKLRLKMSPWKPALESVIHYGKTIPTIARYGWRGTWEWAVYFVEDLECSTSYGSWNSKYSKERAHWMSHLLLKELPSQLSWKHHFVVLAASGAWSLTLMWPNILMLNWGW